MKKLCAISGAAFSLLAVFAMRGTAQLVSPMLSRATLQIMAAAPVGQSQTEPAPLKLLQNIPLPGVEGALDHMGIDVQGQRLFVPAEQHGTIEVLDLRTGRRLRTISAARWPSTIFFHPQTKEIFVSDRSDGTCKVFSGDTYELVKSIKLAVGADNAAYEPHSQNFYIATAGRHAGLPYTLIAIVNTATSEHLGDIKVDSSNVQAMAFEPAEPKMYADLADQNKIAVIDRQKRIVLTTWSTLPECQGPFALALDSAHHRLFVGCRMYPTQAQWWQPGKLVVLDTGSGRTIAVLDAGGGADEMFFDPESQRIYLQGYEGIADVYKEVDPDHYVAIARIQGGVHGKTSLLVPESKRYYVAVSQHQDIVTGVQGGKIEEGYIAVYEVQP